MKKRRADSLVEILIAFLIIIIAISISVLASSQVNELKKQAVVKTHIYDLAYSVAEEQLSANHLLYSTDLTTTGSTTTTIEANDFQLTFTITAEPTSITFFGESIHAAQLKVELADGTEEEYKIQMLVIPKQP